MSQELTRALTRASEISALLERHLPSSVSNGLPGAAVAAAMFAIVLQHRVATIVLVDHDLRTSAFSLARPGLEAYIKGMWAQHCASSKEIERMFADDGWMPGVESMTRRLDEHQPLQGQIGLMKRTLWGPFSDFTHGGMRQLSRWLANSDLEPTHADSETVDLLTQSDIYGLMAGIGILQLADQDDQVFALKAMALLEEERKRRGLPKRCGG